jgi:hypothetical protein
MAICRRELGKSDAEKSIRANPRLVRRISPPRRVHEHEDSWARRLGSSGEYRGPSNGDGDADAHGSEPTPALSRAIDIDVAMAFTDQSKPGTWRGRPGLASGTAATLLLEVQRSARHGRRLLRDNSNTILVRDESRVAGAVRHSQRRRATDERRRLVFLGCQRELIRIERQLCQPA